MTEQNEPEDVCRPVEVGGETIRVHGAGEMSATSRAALAEIVGAARRMFEQEHPSYEVHDPERRERYAQALYVTLEVTPRRHPWETLSPLRRTVWYQRAEAAMAMADVELAAAQAEAVIERVREAMTYAELIVATTGPGPASAVQAVLDRLRTALDGPAPGPEATEATNNAEQVLAFAEQPARTIPNNPMIHVQPREHCGDLTPAFFGTDSVRECVLRPGHSGSHADEYGGRWRTVTEPTDAQETTS